MSRKKIHAASQQPLLDANGTPRLWFQGEFLDRAKFMTGQRYSIVKNQQDGMITLVIDCKGEYVVSKKEKNGRVLPIVDLRSHKLLGMFAGMTAVRVVIQEGRIWILAIASEVRRLQRINRVKCRLAANEPLYIGSTAHGGGILSNAIHKGLSKAGLSSKLAWANDIRMDLLDHAARWNPCWTKDTIGVAMPLQELAFDPYLMSKLDQVDILEAGIPCSGASVAGRAKRGTSMPEQHPEVGHLVAAFISLIAQTNPLVLILENVIPYFSSASMAILRTQLSDLGYDCHETQINGSDWNCLEDRKRMALVAVTKGMKFSWNSMRFPEKKTLRLGDIMDNIPDDDSRWGPMQGLKDKEARDLAAGKGFKMQIFDKDSTSICTITKGVAKNRSTDAKIRHPKNPDLLRIPTPREHALSKGIDPACIGDLSPTIAHEMLGQSVNEPPFIETGFWTGVSILDFFVSCKEEEKPFELTLASAA